MALAVINDGKALSFRRTVECLRDINNTDLSSVDEEILTRLHSQVPMIPDLAGHLINAGGKRLRPIFTLTAAKLLGYQGYKHIPLAAAVELIHGATLLHDDVVDGSSLRRGARTANIIWGNKESVLVGDYIFSRAFELMVMAENLSVLQILSHASSVIAEGEVLQLSTQNNLDTNVSMYLKVVNAKTAALFAAATHAGAVIADASDEQTRSLEKFGRNFGIAYQLVDDALDYAGFETKLGKAVGDDFREGKMTLPIIISAANANPEERDFWKRTITDGKQQEGDFAKACSYIKKHDAVAQTFTLAEDYANAALENLSALPQNNYTQLLGDLVETSLTRAS